MHRVNIPAHLKVLLQQIGQLADQHGLSAYAVGGCVRDWVLRLGGTEDLDVVVEGSGIEVAQATARTLGGTVEAYHQFGTATLVIRYPPARRLQQEPGWAPARRSRSPGRPARRQQDRSELKRRHTDLPNTLRIDFATCRKERYAKPAAYPSLSAGTLEEDLFRRDFTVNAMAMAIAPGRFGTLIDPFNGVRDLRRKELRILHDRSFVDDPSRLLRGVRFLQRFGLRWEPDTEHAAREAIAAGALGWLNTGRLRRELDRMCHEPDPWSCFKQLAALLEGAMNDDA
jgi:tRNA nucleotidyltransferase (CCA-adding enzyme)